MRIIEIGNLVFDIKCLIAFQAFYKRDSEQYELNIKLKGASGNDIIIFFNDEKEYKDAIIHLTDEWQKYLDK